MKDACTTSKQFVFNLNSIISSDQVISLLSCLFYSVYRLFLANFSFLAFYISVLISGGITLCPPSLLLFPAYNLTSLLLERHPLLHRHKTITAAVVVAVDIRNNTITQIVAVRTTNHTTTLVVAEVIMNTVVTKTTMEEATHKMGFTKNKDLMIIKVKKYC